MAGDRRQTSGTVKMKERNGRKERRMMLEAFLVAMKEDLAEWLSCLMKTHIDPKDFMVTVENGVILCQAANIIQTAAEKYARGPRDKRVKIPPKGVHVTTKGALSGSFVARDNVANFIAWCRALGIGEAIIFESEDLVLHKNEKRVILTLLDVARKANKFGVKPPEIVILEEEIDRELELDRKRQLAGHVERVLVLEKDNNLDDLVKEVVDQCCCHSQFPVKKLADGKYKVGKQKTLIFVRVMRNHVMVRVGGGWDTLTHYVEKHDPCRVQVAGQLDESGKCGQKFSSDDTPLRHGGDQTWDDESICSTESSGSLGTFSSGSLVDGPSTKPNIRGFEAAPPHSHNGQCCHPVTSSPRTRRRTMTSAQRSKQDKNNGLSNNTQRWVQNHTDSPPQTSSPRLRAKTWGNRSPVTPRKDYQSSTSNVSSKFSPRLSPRGKTDGRGQAPAYQRPSAQTIASPGSKPATGIPAPIRRGSNTASGIPRPLFHRSKTLELNTGESGSNRRRTATYSTNGVKPGGRLSMVGRREKSMDSISPRQAVRAAARRRTESAVKANGILPRTSSTKTLTAQSPGCRRRLAANDFNRDCRTLDNRQRSPIQPRPAVFTV